MAGLATIMSNILVYLARKRRRKLNELEMRLAETLKKMYRSRDGMIRKVEKIQIPLQGHTAMNQN
jgi:hypothetical protein